MTDTEVLIDLLEIQQRGIHTALDDAPQALIAYRPDPEANNVSNIVWHFTRLADYLLTNILGAKASEEQLWFTEGWADKTDYYPLGKGAHGWGTLMGYSKEEMLEVPILERGDLLSYFDAVYAGLKSSLQTLDGSAEVPAAGGDGEKTVLYWTKLILVDNTRHLGQIQYLKAMFERMNEA